MPTLRLAQTAEGTDAWRVEVALEGERIARRTATARFPFHFSVEDEKDLRWYLEDYLNWPHDPAPKIAARVEELPAEEAGSVRILLVICRPGGGDDVPFPGVEDRGEESASGRPRQGRRPGGDGGTARASMHRATRRRRVNPASWR